MNATFESARVLKLIVDATKDLLVQTNLECTETGLVMSGMDPSHVALCTVRMPAEGMKAYQCAHPHVLGLPLGNLSKILSTAGPSDALRIVSTSEERLQIDIVPADGSRAASFELALLTIDQESIGVPDEWRPSHEARFDSAAFHHVVRDLAIVGDTFGVEMTAGETTFFTEGELGKARITLHAPAATSSAAADTRASLAFPLRYLQMFTKATPLAKEVSVGVVEEQPMRITDTEEWGSIVYFLAPKLEDR
jgi:proliferating cell nuclear antigen